MAHSLSVSCCSQELDLSSNLLGKDETLSSVIPSTVTAGQSLSRLLTNGIGPLKKLNVHWNMIRLESAKLLCSSIRYARHLLHLNLSYNAIGRAASTILGSALIQNSTLEELILSNNSIDAVGCFTLVVGVRESPSLKFIDLDGNPIGQQGGRMLIKLAKCHGTKVTFSANNCDVTVKSSEVVFKIDEPSGSYELDLSNPYHCAIAFEMLDVVALDPTLGFKVFHYKEPRGKAFNAIELDKFRCSLKSQFTDKIEAELRRLKAIVSLASDSSHIEKTFRSFDKDGSGELNTDEFEYLLRKLGFDSSETKVSAIMMTLDTDGGDVINLDQMTEYIYNLGQAAAAQIIEIESYPMFSLSSSYPPVRFVPPSTGTLRVEIHESLRDSENKKGCMTSEHCQSVIKAIGRTTSPSLMLQYAMELSLLYLDEAMTIYRHLQDIEDSQVHILARILPRMATTLDANSLVKICLGGDLKAMRHLKKVMGMSYSPILGMYNGYYFLDLVKESDRACLHKLFERSIHNAVNRQGEGKYDTSQNGNWTCFRNILKDGKIITFLQAEKYSPMPKFGRLEFDFIDTTRPNHEIDRPIHMNKFISVLNSCYLVKSSAHASAVLRHCAEKRYNHRFSMGDQGQVGAGGWAADTGRIVNVYEHLSRMYKSIDTRYSSYEKSFKREVFAENATHYEENESVTAFNDDDMLEQQKPRGMLSTYFCLRNVSGGVGERRKSSLFDLLNHVSGLNDGDNFGRRDSDSSSITTQNSANSRQAKQSLALLHQLIQQQNVKDKVQNFVKEVDSTNQGRRLSINTY